MYMYMCMDIEMYMCFPTNSDCEHMYTVAVLQVKPLSLFLFGFAILSFALLSPAGLGGFGPSNQICEDIGQVASGYLAREMVQRKRGLRVLSYGT